MHKPIMLIFTLSLLGSLCVGLVGPIYPIYVLKRFSATIVDTGILYATFCIVAGQFSRLQPENWRTNMEYSIRARAVKPFPESSP